MVTRCDLQVPKNIDRVRRGCRRGRKNLGQPHRGKTGRTRSQWPIQRGVVARIDRVEDGAYRGHAGASNLRSIQPWDPAATVSGGHVFLCLDDINADARFLFPRFTLGEALVVVVRILAGLDLGLHLLARFVGELDGDFGLPGIGLEQLIEAGLGALQQVQGQRGDAGADHPREGGSDRGKFAHDRFEGGPEIELAAGVVQARRAGQAEANGGGRGVGRSRGGVAAAQAVVEIRARARHLGSLGRRCREGERREHAQQRGAGAKGCHQVASIQVVMAKLARRVAEPASAGSMIRSTPMGRWCRRVAER